MKQIQAEKVVRMARGKEERSRKCADRIVSNIAAEVGAWEDVTITYSLISGLNEKIIYRSRNGYKSGFYDRNDNPWDINLRGEEYWAGALLIVNWYHNKRVKYRRI